MLPPDPDRNRILIVDDELPARRMLVRILEKEGPYRCMTAASTAEAKGLLKSNTFGLVITDSRMWGEEGIELIRAIGDEYPDTVTIMVSGQNDPKLEATSLQAGALYFIRKPFSAADVLEKVADALDQREESRKLRRHREG